MESRLIATQPSNLLTLDRQKIEDTAADSTFAMFSSIAILTAMAVSTYAVVSRERQKSYTKKSCQNPCTSCEYFDGNNYLNCAIHPTTVRTEAAIDCIDYCPNRQTRRTEELKKALPFASKFFPNRSN